MNRSLRRVVLALAIGALCALAVAACGEDFPDTSSAAAQLLEQTVKATSTSLHDGRLDARLTLEPKGLLAIGGPITLDVKGPFARPERDGLPRLDLAAVATVAGQRYPGGLVSDGARAFLTLDGRAYRLDAKGAKHPFTSLGLDPLRSIEDEHTKGHEQIAGSDTIRVTGTVDAKRLLADLHELVPAKLGTQLARAVRSADVELWSGADDKILRQLVMRVAFEVAAGEKPPIQGLQAGTITLRVRLDDVNAGQPRITTPARALPLSKLPKDRGLGGLVACLSDSAGLARCVAALRP